MEVMKKKISIRKNNILFVFLFLVFLFLLFYGFPNSPSPWFDEGVNLGVAKSWVENSVYGLELGPGEYIQQKHLITTGYPVLGWIGLSFQLFGVGMWQAKIVMILFLISFFFLTYSLVKKYYGQKMAYFSLILVISFLPLYGNGKSVLGEVPGLVYFLSGLLLLDKKKWWHILLSGLLFGLAAATKPTYLLFIFAVFGGEVWLSIKNRKIEWKRCLLLGIGGTLPLVIWILTLLPDVVTWTSVMDILNFYRNPYDVPLNAVVGQNLWRFVSESTPLHFNLLFMTFIISKFIRRKFTHVEVVISIFVFLNLFFYVKTVGWYRYFFPAHLLLFILFIPALYTIVQRIPFSKLKIYGMVAVVGFLVLFQSVHLVLNINKKLYYNPQPQEFGEKVNQLVSHGTDVLVVNIPHVAFFLTAPNVWQYLKINPNLSTGRDWFDGGRLPDYVIIEKQNMFEISEVALDLDVYYYEEILYDGGYALLRKNL